MSNAILKLVKPSIKKTIQNQNIGFSVLGAILSAKFYNRPIFVVGLGRSGTSILLASLGQHKQIICARREVPIFPYIGQIAYQLASGPQAEHFQYCCRISNNIVHKHLRRLLFEICWGPNYGLLKFMESWINSPKKTWNYKYWIARTFPDLRDAIGIRKIYPLSKFVHIYRNGVDVVSSRRKYDAFKKDPFEKHCILWADSVEKYKYLRNEKYSIAISQEQLLTQRKSTFEAIINFLGLDQDESPSNFAKNTVLIPHDIARSEERVNGTNAVDYFNKRLPSHYDWSKSEKDIFKKICGEGMEELGYHIPF